MTTLPCALLLISLAAASAPQDSAGAARNPFAGFETHVLPNGVKVWYRRLPGAPDVSASVAVPYGHDVDPPGKQELAHFTEHMLFSDHRGRTEQEIKEEIEGRGGRRNGWTFADRTLYYVTIAPEHGLLALEWLGRLVEPHDMSPEVVERNRQPVANEIGARPLELGDRIVAALDPEILRPPGLWKREFGLDTREGRRWWERWKGLQAIDPEDLRAFYDRYYAPGAMTVTVVGDLPRDSVLAVAARTFGRLPERPLTRPYASPRDPARYRLSASWDFAARPRYRTIFKVFEPTAGEHVLLLFVRDLLDRRLENRLRFGERKAVYGVSVPLVRRGPVLYLGVQASVDEEDLAWAREVVEEELEMLRTGSWPEGAFETDRRALVEQLRTRYQVAEDLNFLAMTSFYDRSLHHDFPDLLTAYQRLEPEELAAFARTALVRPRRVEWIRRPHPVGQAGVAAGAFLVLLLSVRGTGRLLTSPVAMERIRYVARIRLSLPFLVVTVSLFAGAGLVLARLFVWGGELLVRYGISAVDSYPFQMAAFALLVAAGVGTAIGYLSLLPRKILVFSDHVRIKNLSFRSRRITADDVEELALLHFPAVWGTRRIAGTLPFTTGLLRPGIYLAPRAGPALFFRTRDVEGLFRAMRRALEVEGTPAPGSLREA